MRTTSAKLFMDGAELNTTPIYSDSVKITFEREKDEMYRRTKLEGEFKFVKADFHKIYDAYMDAQFEIRLYDEDGILLAKGTFERTDCEFNVDDECCIVSVSSSDVYDKILAGMDNEYDLVSLAPERETITLMKRAILQIYVLKDTKLTNIVGNMSYEVDVASGIDTDNITASELKDTYNFEQIQSGTPTIIVSAVPSGFEYLLGNYEGYYDGTINSLFTQVGGTNKIGVRSRTWATSVVTYHWCFLDSNNEPIYKDGSLIQTRPYGRIRSPLEPMLWGYAAGAYQSFVRDDAWSTHYDAKDIFARILMDEVPTTPSGDVMRLASEDFVASNLNYHYSMKPTGIDGLADRLVTSDVVQDAPTKWGVNGNGKYFVQPNPKSTGDNVIPIGWNRWIPYSYWFDSSRTLAETIDIFSSSWELNDAYPLWSAISVLLGQIDPSITFSGTANYSKFLYGTIASSEIYGWIAQYLYITPITNVKKTYYSQAARKGTITLGQILEMLRATCQLYWFIDSSNRLRIEHISWFKNGGNYSQTTPLIDLTESKCSLPDKSWAFGQNTIKFSKSDLLKRYEFAWNDSVSDVFEGFPIDITDKFVGNGKTNKAQASNFISDVDLIMSTPDTLSDDCFALIGTTANKVCPIEGLGNFNMDFVAPVYVLQNPYLSFYRLELAYWVYNLGGYRAETSTYKTSKGENGVISVSGTQRVKTQTLRFPLASDLVGKEGLIKAGLGSGEWTKMTYTPEDGMVDAEIIMETAGVRVVSLGTFATISGKMTYEYDYGDSKAKIGFYGNNDTAPAYGYVKVTAKTKVRAAISATTLLNYGYAWVNASPLTGDTSAALLRVTGLNTAYKDMAAGATLYFGYSKIASRSWSVDKAEVEFEEI